MQGRFDNSPRWLEEMPPSEFSTEEHASRLAQLLKKNTGVPWVVTLVSLEYRGKGGGVGGFFISPTPNRLKNNVISKKDWGYLTRFFGAFEADVRRWYLFPDEIAAAFEILGEPLIENNPEKKQKNT